jgi:hypothetical protein
LQHAVHAQSTAHLSDSSMGPTPQELAPFRVPSGTPGGCPGF